MNLEHDVVRALQALGEGDRHRQAPPEVETKLRRAFERHTRLRKWRRISAIAVAAGVVVVLVANYSGRPRVEPQVSTIRPLEPATTVLTPEAPVVASRVPRMRTPRTIRREIATDFFPLLDVPPPIQRGELVRVSLPAAAMRSVGLPVREDRLTERVQADVLMSEEGLATAIRFIKVSQ